MIAACPLTLHLTREQPTFAHRPDRDRALHRVRAGVYVDFAEWAALSPWDRYLVRVHAVARTWSSPAFMLESAAALHRLPVFNEPREIHILSPDGTSWREGDVVVHAARDGRDLVSVEGFLLTSLAETALDLCRVLPPAFALAVADASLRRLLPRGQALDLSERGRSQANRRGLRQLDWVQERATSLSESTGESVSRAVIEWLGYEEPELQQKFFYEGVHDRSDFYWRRLRMIGESDGYGKYDADSVEDAKAHFIGEKLREDRLRRHEDGFVRWDWSDTVRWRPLDAKLGAGGLVAVRPQQRAMLATLASNPRSLDRKSVV